jgi:glycosyltransferase involved in cell wall biosynthesis
MKNIIYSICITNYNTYPIVEQSINAILSQIDQNFEVVVVDNCSKDGSLEILERYQREGLIRLFVQKCSRGVGRQLAFEESKGKYIISQLDLDDITGNIRDVIEFYHRCLEGKILVLDDFMIGPRNIFEEIGGWRDLNWGEDFDLWSRAAKAGKLAYIDKSIRLKVGKVLSKRTLGRLVYDYYVYRDSFRVSRPTVRRWANKRLDKKLGHILIAAVAYITYRFYPSYKDPFNRTFKLSDYKVKDDC